MKNFYFTFGLAHPFHAYVQKIRAKDENAARATMHEVYGTKWAFCYGPYADGEVENAERIVTLGDYKYMLTPQDLVEGYVM